MYYFISILSGIEEKNRTTKLRICGDHFRSSDFSTPACDKLIRGKVPIPFDQVDDAQMPDFDQQKAVRTYKVSDFNLLPSPSHVSREEENEDSTFEEKNVAQDPAVSVNDRILYLEAENERLRNMMQKMQKQFEKQASMKDQQNAEENEEFDVEKFLDKRKVTNENCRAMIKLQLRPTVKTSLKFSEEEMDLAMKLHFYSASGYDKMRKDGLILPHSRTVEKRVARIEVPPGFLKPVLKNLKMQLQGMPESARKCIVKFDEMDIMEKLEYDSWNDIIEGFEDLGPLGRTQRRANKVFAVTLNSLDTFHPWQALILYVLPHNGVFSEDLVILIKMSIDEATECGADVKMIVCDQGGPNRSAYAQLGVTAENPFFYYKEKKVLAIHDFCHAVKNLISAWQRYKVLIINGKNVPFNDVIATWKADRANKLSNTLGHLTADHMKPNNFQRQNVRMAFQLVSGKLTCAMEAASATKAVVSPTLNNTIWFTMNMNDVVDVCNSSNVYDKNPLKRPLSTKNPKCIEVLKDFLKWGSTIQVWNKSKKNKKLTSLPCFNALIMVVKGLLKLYEDMIENDPSCQLCTRFCNQDSVETLFSKFRGRGGFNPNPTCRMLRLTVRHLVAVKNMASSSRGNVVRDDSNYFPALTPEELRQQSKSEEVEEETAVQRAIEFFETGKVNRQEDNDDVQADESEEEDDEEVEKEEDIAIQDRNVKVQDPVPFEAISGTLEGLSVAYFAGYAAFKTVQKFKCNDCLKVMQKPPDDEEGDMNDQYIEYREYEADFSYKIHLLARPTEKFRHVVTANLKTFVKFFNMRKQTAEGLRKALIEDAKREMLEVDPEWYSTGPCQEHREFATNILFIAKVHRHCILDNRAAKQEKLTKRRVKAAAKKEVAKETAEAIEKKRSAKEDTSEEEEEKNEELDDQKHSRHNRKLKVMKHQ